jgi:tetratricopeptide (TPR) repeat protein
MKPTAKLSRKTSPSGKEVPEKVQVQGSNWSWPTIPAGVALVAMVLVAYSPLLKATYIWDDDSYVTGNLTLRSLEGLRRIWFELRAVPQYYPLVHTTFWTEYHLWNLAPLGFHIDNVLLHAASVLLVWRLLARLRVPGAWLAAALFAVHPVEVESVAWVTERKNVLSLALALGSMLCYLRFAPAEEPEIGAPANATRWRSYVLAFVLFVAAMLSKTVVASLPAVLLVIYWWKRGRITLADIVPLVPFFAVGAGLGLLTVWMEKHHVGATGEIYDSPLIERLLIAGRALWFYAAKLVWPYPLTFFYPRWAIDAHVVWQCLFPITAFALPIVAWFTRRWIGRGALASLLIFAGVLFPALGFFNVYPFRFSYVADHFQYHAGLALITLVASAAAMVAAGQPPHRKKIMTVAGALPLIALGLLTYRQVRVYRDPETLFRDTIADNPESWAAYENLESYFHSQGRFDEALALARDAMARDSLTTRADDPLTRTSLAIAHNNLGGCLLRMADRAELDAAQTEEVIFHEQEALRLDPQLITAYCNLASALMVADRPDEAIQQFDRALMVSPGNPEALCGKGRVLDALGRQAEAETSFRQALEQNPDFARAHHDLALLLINQGRSKEALPHLESALRLEPRIAEAHYALGGIFAGRGDYRLAAEHYQTAIELQANYPRALNNLGAVLMNLGETDRAIHCFQEAVRQSPDYADARLKLEQALEIRRGEQAGPSPRIP